MNIVLTIIVTVFIFCVLIALHELGHYLVARFFGVGIREYSIGMGPKLFQRQGKYNKFTLRALPIGGYVDMVGENSDDDGSAPEDAGKTPLNTKPIWQRMLIVLAGPVTNILLGLLIMAILVLFQSNLYGTTIDYFGASAISDDNMVYLTEDFGEFQKGDIIYAADGKIVNANDLGLTGFVDANKGAKEFLVIRKNSTDFVFARYVSVNFEKLKLAVDNGYVCVAEDVYNSEGVLAAQKNDIIYSINGVLCAKDTDVDGYAKKYGTAISFDLNYRASFWINREKELSAIFDEIASVSDILIGNEEDFQLALGIKGPEAGGKNIGDKIEGFKGMVENVRKQ